MNDNEKYYWLDNNTQIPERELHAKGLNPEDFRPVEECMCRVAKTVNSKIGKITLYPN